MLSSKLHSYESDDSVPKSPVNDMYKSGEGYHAVPPPYTRTFMPPKPELVSDSEDEYDESVPKQKDPSFVPTSEQVRGVFDRASKNGAVVEERCSDFYGIVRVRALKILSP
uniref:Uncharacterized protein n=1 Tax=Tanacetum cinerariifolium TaxID=118510 RepID=A0A6L2NUC8_TANCI|nr:hypothetical protein [Tanacetum cinerariifolium]